MFISSVLAYVVKETDTLSKVKIKIKIDNVFTLRCKLSFDSKQPTLTIFVNFLPTVFTRSVVLAKPLPLKQNLMNRFPSQEVKKEKCTSLPY